MHYVTKYASTLPNIQMMVSADMFGWQYGSYSTYINIDSGWSINSALNSTLSSAMSTYGGFSHVQVDTHQYNYSDHISFVNHGVPAVLLIEYNFGSNPNYHRQTDSVDMPNYINYTYATNAVRGLTGWLCNVAGLNGTLSSAAPASQSDPSGALAEAPDDLGAVLKGAVR